MAVLLASYMSGVFWKKTALLECNRHGDFFRMMERHGLCGKDGICFRFMGIDFFPSAAEGCVADCLNKGYDCIVIDFGCDYIRGRREFLRCQRKIVLGSVSDWESAGFTDFMRWTQMDQEESWMYAALFGGRRNRKRLEKETGKSVAEVPFLESPYWIDETVLRFFQRFLK